MRATLLLKRTSTLARSRVVKSPVLRKLSFSRADSDSVHFISNIHSKYRQQAAAISYYRWDKSCGGGLRLEANSPRPFGDIICERSSSSLIRVGTSYAVIGFGPNILTNLCCV